MDAKEFQEKYGRDYFINQVNKKEGNQPLMQRI